MSDANEELEAELAEVLAKLTPSVTVRPSPTFASRVRAAARAEGERNVPLMLPRPTAHAFSRRPARAWKPALALAACVTVGVLIGRATVETVANKRAPDVAWGEVVAAVRQVSQFHIAWLDDTDPAHNGDAYFRAPGLWRLHHQDAVVFGGPGKNRVYGMKEGRMLDPSDERAKGYDFDPAFRAGLARDPLQGFLHMIFRDAIPRGEPVKGAAEALDGDMEVFDYAKDAKRQWARIWVLRNSRLPVRIVVYEPEIGSSVTVLFDYSDGQPETYFDATHFLKAMGSTRPGKMRDAIRIGQTLTDGKPKSAQQIYELQDGYRAPEVKKVERVGDDTILISTTNPENRTPSGNPAAVTFESLARANDGRVFVRTWDSGTSVTTVRNLYVPLDGKPVGPGINKLTVKYVVANYQGDTPLFQRELALDVPEGTRTPDEKEASMIGPEIYRETFVRHEVANDTPMPLLRWLDAQLAAKPDGTDHDELLRAKVEAILRLGGEPEAWKLYEATLREMTLADPTDDFDRVGLLAKYVRWLSERGRMDEALAISDLVRDAVAKIDPKSFKASYLKFGLTAIADLRGTVASFAGSNAPRVTKYLRSADGFTALQLELPAGPSVGDGGTRWIGGNSSITAPGWRPYGSYSAGNKQVLVFFTGKTPLTLQFLPAVGAEGDASNLRVAWNMPVPEGEATPAKDWDELWKAAWEGTNAQHANVQSPNATSAPAKADGVRALLDEGQAAMRREDWATALKAQQQAVQIPAQQWPSQGSDKPELEAFLKQQEYFHTQLNIADLLAKLGRFDEAIGELDALEAALPAMAAFPPDNLPSRKAQVLFGQAAIATQMRMQGKVTQARAFINALNASRPNFLDTPEERRTLNLPWGQSTSSPRANLIRAWTYVDAEDYQLEKAEGKR